MHRSASVCVALILVCGSINVLPTKRVGQILAVGTVLQVRGRDRLCMSVADHFSIHVDGAAGQILVAFVFIITLPAVAETHQPASWVFGHFEVQYSITGIPNGAYAVVAGGPPMSQFTTVFMLCAFDAAAHPSEEKRQHQTTPTLPLPSLILFPSQTYAVVAGLLMSQYALYTIYGATHTTEEAKWTTSFLPSLPLRLTPLSGIRGGSRPPHVTAYAVVAGLLMSLYALYTIYGATHTTEEAKWTTSFLPSLPLRLTPLSGIRGGSRPPHVTAYAVVAGLLMSQYALYAFDAAAHTSEEAKRSDVTTPFAMIAALSLICFVQWGVIVALTFCIQVGAVWFTWVRMVAALSLISFVEWGVCHHDSHLLHPGPWESTIKGHGDRGGLGRAACLARMHAYLQDPKNLLSPDTVTGGDAAEVQILWDVFYGRFGNGTGACVFLGLFFISFFFATITLILAAARVGYALSRDRGLPLSFLWRRVNSSKVPVNAIACTSAIAILFLVPLLGGSVAYFAVTGMATVGWFGAYGVPVFFRIIQSDKDFAPGPFFLANYIGHTGGKCVHVLALTYVVYTMVVFVIPTEYPVTAENFNYAAVGIVVVVAMFLLWWFLDAHRWFKGPKIAKQEDQVDAKPQEQQEQYQFSLTISTHSEPADVAIEKPRDVGADVAAGMESDSDGEVVSKEAAIGGTLAAGALIVSVVASLALLGYYYRDEISGAIDYFTTYIEGAGSGGYVTFVLGYSLLEVLAVPAIPLTLSAGVLFGPVMGTFLCSLSGTVSATIAFLIARYVARDRIQDMVRGNKKYEAIDRAVGNNSFRIVTLLRLSPLMPFSLGNYFYGLTSVKLLPYIFGTWIGMLPGTWAYVSAGSFGRSLLEAESGSSLLGDSSLYSLLGGVALTAFAATYITKIVQDAVKEAE
ncbi:unnamed protein product [Closterium sp. Naga37s-1]|nr:unnamed protein product [Closterium sp. Naga37s-1]